MPIYTPPAYTVTVGSNVTGGESQRRRPSRLITSRELTQSPYGPASFVRGPLGPRPSTIALPAATASAGGAVFGSTSAPVSIPAPPKLDTVSRVLRQVREALNLPADTGLSVTRPGGGLSVRVTSGTPAPPTPNPFASRESYGLFRGQPVSSARATNPLVQIWRALATPIRVSADAERFRRRL